jgi:integrase
MSKRPRGTGSLYLPPGSTNWHCKYYINGVPKRETTGTANKREAQRFLQKRLNAVASGRFLGPEIDRITIKELVEDLLRSYKVRGNASYKDDLRRWKLHLQPRLGHLRVAQLSTSLLNQYVEGRQAEPITKTIKGQPRTINKFPQNATINRELALLRAAYYLGKESDPPKVQHVPTFHLLPENPPRKGFLKDDQYLRLADECGKVGLWLRSIFEVYFTYGWRKAEVISNIRVSQVDLNHRTIDLEPGTTKNKQGRVIKMTQKVFELVSACIEGKKPDELVFTRDGKPILDFRKSWQNVCEAAGLAGLKVHDLRRTGARNLRRLGVHESTIMRIGGWKTRSLFDRYNIVDESDLVDAADRVDEKQQKLLDGHSTGIVRSEKTEDKTSAVN